MKGCLAPSEIPRLTSRDVRHFGNFAEDLITSEYRGRRSFGPMEVYIDNYNPGPYLYFIVHHNPAFSRSSQIAYYRQAYLENTYRRPDMLIHTAAERAYYEVKPDSASGRADGNAKVAILESTYRACNLPYRAGTAYSDTRILLASFGSLLRVHLEARLIRPGLIVYRICLESQTVLDVATLALILRYIVLQVLRQRRNGSFKPVDLEPAFAKEGQLGDLAVALGLAGGVVVAARKVPWKYFWKAVAKRFAVRGTAAAALSVADGPLPVGELLSVGLALWTVVDIIRLSDVLWADAETIQNSGA